MLHEIGLVACIFAAAVLYSSVGHAGASGYLAAMALFAVAPESMKPAALVLNILVAVIGSVRFVRAGAFSMQVFLPFAVTSIPMAFIGGMWTLPGRAYKIIVGIALLLAAARLIFTLGSKQTEPKAPSWWIALPVGAAVGLLSGMTGVGGGIYLTPLLLLAGWADPRTASGVSVVFILVNSLAGLAGQWQTSVELPPDLPYWAAAAVVGGLIGSYLGVHKYGAAGLKRMLAVVLVIAGIKLALT